MTVEEECYANANASKANFEDIYDQPDPRAYYQQLGRLDYAIPSEAKPVFLSVIDALKEIRDRGVPTLADVGCSYGVNAALLKYDLEFDDLVDRYSHPKFEDASVAKVLHEDLTYYQRQEPTLDVDVVGLDIAECAVEYARRVGLIETAIAENLENKDPSPHAAKILSEVDIVASTGCVGYVTERSFERMLAEAPSDSPPWIASFVLRMFPYDRIAESLASQGLVTEKLRGVTFPQRRFASEKEKRSTIEAIRELGRNPAGLESEGRFHAEFYLSRPVEEVKEVPLDRIVEKVLPDGEGVVAAAI